MKDQRFTGSMMRWFDKWEYAQRMATRIGQGRYGHGPYITRHLNARQLRRFQYWMRKFHYCYKKYKQIHAIYETLPDLKIEEIR